MDLESEFRLDEDAAEVVVFLAENGGAIEVALSAWRNARAWRRAWSLLADLASDSAKDERYYVGVGWIRCPSAPPSVKFAMAVRSSLTDIHAWPNVPGYRPVSLTFARSGPKRATRPIRSGPPKVVGQRRATRSCGSRADPPGRSRPPIGDGPGDGHGHPCWRRHRVPGRY